MKRLLLLAVGLWVSAPRAESPFLEKLQTEVVDARCRDRFLALRDLRLLEAWKGLPAFLKTGKATKEARAQLDAFSTDLLLHLVLELEQRFLVSCPKVPFARSLVREMKGAYLRHLGLTPKTDALLDTLFRGFLATRDDLPALGAKLRGARETAPLKLLARVYGFGETVNGVVMVASKPVPLGLLRKRIRNLCPKGPCRFWNPVALYKVLVTDHDGLAAYVPETASLVLSRSLLETDDALHRLVLVHELAHVAARDAQVRDGRDWVAEFAAFSGWGAGEGPPTAVTSPTARADELTRLSASSPFSLLPDPVYVGAVRGEKRFEGFVFGRTFERALSSGDLSEDLADHVAAFVVAPSRYCHGGRAVAPGKYAWVAKEVFGMSRKLNCGAGK